MRVLVCGGRDFSNWELLCNTLDNLYDFDTDPYMTVISGGAKGADTLAEVWVRHSRTAEEDTQYIFSEVYLANWDKHGNSAGPIRNQQMLDEGRPDLVIAFPGGKGTADMIRRSKKAGVKVVEIVR